MKAMRISFLILAVCLSFSVALLSSAASDTRPSSSPDTATPLMTFNPAIDTLALGRTSASWFIGAEPKEKLKTYTGFLTEGLQLMCMKSEGPDYYLQFYEDEQNGIRILKHGSNAPFAHDFTLDAFLLTKVTITGIETPIGVDYVEIKPFYCGLEGKKSAKETTFNGYLFAKLDNIGSMSEGPSYYLQGFDYSELLVAKKCNLWENDPNLHPLLNTKVTITGEMGDGGLIYTAVKPYTP
jgi:hypothetical protein